MLQVAVDFFIDGPAGRVDATDRAGPTTETGSQAIFADVFGFRRGEPPSVCQASASASSRACSGRGRRVARGGLWRLRRPQYGAEGRLAERFAERPVGPEGCRDLGRIVLLPP